MLKSLNRMGENKQSLKWTASKHLFLPNVVRSSDSQVLRGPHRWMWFSHSTSTKIYKLSTNIENIYELSQQRSKWALSVF